MTLGNYLSKIRFLMTHCLRIHTLTLVSIGSADIFDQRQGCLSVSETYSSPLTAFPSAFYSGFVFSCPLKLWLALYNFTGLCVKELLFIVGFVVTIVVRYTFTGIGGAEQKEEGGKQLQSSWLLCNSSYSRICPASSHF